MPSLADDTRAGRSAGRRAGAASLLALGFLAVTILLVLFEHGLPCRIDKTPDEGLNSDRFLRMLGALANGEIHRDTAVQVLANGSNSVNLAVRDEGLAGQLLADFAADLAMSREISFSEWQGRPLTERVHESLLLERQH